MMQLANDAMTLFTMHLDDGDLSAAYKALNADERDAFLKMMADSIRHLEK